MRRPDAASNLRTADCEDGASLSLRPEIINPDLRAAFKDIVLSLIAAGALVIRTLGRSPEEGVSFVGDLLAAAVVLFETISPDLPAGTALFGVGTCEESSVPAESFEAEDDDLDGCFVV